jgi:HPr kinase/phosphorylase
MTRGVLSVHATTIAIAGCGIMLRGPSGSGKSSLALRVMEQSGTGLGKVNLKASLVADDQTEVFESKGKLWVRCPKTIVGQIEVRGLGIVKVKPGKPCPLALIVDLLPASAVERMPEPGDMKTTLLDHQVPCIRLDASLPAAPSVLRVAFLRLCLPTTIIAPGAVTA